MAALPVFLLVLGNAVWAAAVSMPAAPPLGENLIANPSMDLDADGDGRPDSWRTSADVEYKTRTALGKHPYVIEGIDGGRKSARCLHYRAAEVPREDICGKLWWDLAAWQTARKQTIRTWAIPVVSASFPVLGEREYLFAMWIKARAARFLHLKFIGHYAGLPQTKTHWTQPLLKSPTGETHMDGSWDWRRFSTKLFVPGGQDWGRLEVWLWQDGEPCELWVDDVSAQLVLKDGDER